MGLIQENEDLLRDCEVDIKYWNLYLRYIDEMVAQVVTGPATVLYCNVLPRVCCRRWRSVWATSWTTLMSRSLLSRSLLRYCSLIRSQQNSRHFSFQDMELCEPDIIFKPSLNKKIHNNFFVMFLGLMDDIFRQAQLVPRVHKRKGTSPNCLDTIINHPELKSLKEELIKRVELVMEKADDQVGWLVGFFLTFICDWCLDEQLPGLFLPLVGEQKGLLGRLP